MLQLNHFEEFNSPNLWKAGDYIKHLKTLKDTNPMKTFNSSLFHAQEDLFDCIKPKDSVKGVCRDVFKYLAVAHSRGNRMVNLASTPH